MAEKPLAAVAGIKPRFLFYLRRTGHKLLWVIAMKKNQRRRTTEKRPEPYLAAALLAGAATGSVWGGKLPFLHALTAGESLGAVLWPELILLMLLFFAGFIRGGGLLAALTMAAKGSLLAGEAVLRAGMLGKWAYPAAAAMGFFPGFLTLTAMLLLARQSMTLAHLRAQAARRDPGPDGAFFLTALAGFLAVLLASGLRLWLLPELWAAAASLLSGS